MLFRALKKEDLKRLYDLLAGSNMIVAPVQKGQDGNRAPIYAFEEVSGFGEIHLDYTSTKIPAKRFFMPFRETMADFRMDGKDWGKRVGFNIDRPFVFFGMHACDINALNKLDKVLLGSHYPMPYYAAKRNNMFIVGIDCRPQPYCFCRSMGSDTALHGFDLFLTDLGDHYFVEVLSDTAFNIIRQITTREPAESDHALYMKMVSDKNKQFTLQVNTTDLTKILDMEFQSDVWKQWGEKCFSCGTCANVCPTCYCYGVDESVEMDLSRARKTKFLYACNLIDFAEVAGGHNFRPESHTRLKYRYYHKHRGFVEAYEESLCVGCGRCGESCLAGITVPEVIASVRGEDI
ncbi:MAG: hydrogenase [Nitrospirae bacterium]|nr:hydrogenase [Nitrospirota bacterium]